MTTTTPYVCNECGATRVRTRTGFVCPDGHGKVFIIPSPASAKRRECLAWRDTLPEAVRVRPWPKWKRAAFRIGYGKTLYNYADGYRPCGPETRCSPGHVIAKVLAGGAWLVREFVPIKEEAKQ